MKWNDDPLHLEYCHEGLTYDIEGAISVFSILALIPTLFFLAFLLFTIKKAMIRLNESDSMVNSIYYVFVWGVVSFNVGRLVLLIIAHVQPDPQALFSVLFIFVHSVLLFIEFSVVVFMSHKFTFTGREALPRSIMISLAVSSFFGFMELICVFALKMNIFTPKDEDGRAQIYWFAENLFLSLIYLAIMVLPKTPLAHFFQFPEFRSKPHFYYYVMFLFFLNGLQSFGALLALLPLSIGTCFSDIGRLIYYYTYVPLLYWAFLRDFFRQVTLSSEYSEMMSSGYFDSDT